MPHPRRILRLHEIRKKSEFQKKFGDFGHINAIKFGDFGQSKYLCGYNKATYAKYI